MHPMQTNLARILILGKTKEDADEFSHCLSGVKSLGLMSPPNCQFEFISFSFEQFKNEPNLNLPQYLVILSLFDHREPDQLDYIRCNISERVLTCAPFIFHLIVAIDTNGPLDSSINYNDGEIVVNVTKLTHNGVSTLCRTIRFYVESICNNIQIDFTGFSQIQSLFNPDKDTVERSSIESCLFAPLQSTSDIITSCLYPNVKVDDDVDVKLAQVRGTLESLLIEAKGQDNAELEEYDELPVCDEDVFNDIMSEISQPSLPLTSEGKNTDTVSLKVKLSKDSPELILLDDLSLNPLLLAHNFIKQHTLKASRSATERRVLKKASESLSKAIIQARLCRLNDIRCDEANDSIVGVLRVQFMKYESGDILLNIYRSDILPCSGKGAKDRRLISERIVDRFLSDAMIEQGEEGKRGLVLTMTRGQREKLIHAVDEVIEQIDA